MKNLKMNSISIATIVLSILLVSSIFAVFATAEIGGPRRTTNDLSARVDPVTGQPYGDLSQYEWVSAGNGGENQRYSAGPAPNAPNLLWSKSVGSNGIIPSAFNGLVFAGGSNIRAFNGVTGESVFNATLNGGFPGFGDNNDIVKYNDELWGYLSSNGPVWYNFTAPPAGVAKISEGKSLIANDLNFGGSGFSTIGTSGSATYWGSMYDYASKTWISHTTNSTNGRPIAVAWDCTNLRGQGAPIKWVTTLEVGLESLGFGGGNAYFGGWGEGLIYALSLDTGEIVWSQFKTGNAGYSITYYDGVVYHSASSTQITAFDGATGAILNSFDVAGGRAFFSYGGAAAYGLYFDSSIQVPQGWTSAWNAKTLDQLWKQPSEYTIKYLVGVVADGKQFVCTCDVARGNALPAGSGLSEGYRVAAFDAFTGQEIWSIATSGQVLSPAVAYGNLYMVWGNTLYCYNDNAPTPDKTTGWPFYHGATYAAGTATGQYPSNIKETLWDFEADGPITGSQVAAEGKVFFGTFAGTLYAINANTGDELWTFKVRNASRILSAPAIVNGVVYTGADDGYVYALNATTGDKIWEKFAGGVTRGPLQTAALQINSSPIVYEGKVIVGAQDGNLYAFYTLTGDQLWVAPISNPRYGIGGSAAIVPLDQLGRTKVLVVAQGRLYSLSFNNGNVITNNSLPSATAAGTHNTPTVVDNFVFTESGSGSGGLLMVWNATSMTELGRRTMDKGSGSTPTFASPAYIPNLTVELKNGTNIGYNTSNTGTQVRNKYILNLTTPTTTRDFNVILAIEAQEVGCWALIPNGTNLGGSTAATRWIVNVTTPYTMVRLWSNWVGHQSFGSPVVAINAQTPRFNAIVYEGNSVYGFTAYNVSSGAVLSTYTATAQVFTTPALYQNKLYVGDSAGFVHAFGKTDNPEFVVPTATIFAQSNKGEEMFANEPMDVEGRLTAVQIFGTEEFRPPLPFTTVYFTFENPDNTTTALSTTTDLNGNFNFTFTPTQTGGSQWLVYSNAFETLNGMYMNGAYAPWTEINVVTPGGNNPTTPTPSSDDGDTGGPIAIEYIIAAIVAVIVVIAVIAAVLALRKRKH